MNQLVSKVFPHCSTESEREERERKGDLDKFERLDGDRNQTTKFLAVKKVVSEHLFFLSSWTLF